MNKNGCNTEKGWTQTGYPSRHCIINQEEEKHRTPEEKMEGPTLP
jgi:hypothetical protein